MRVTARLATVVLLGGCFAMSPVIPIGSGKSAVQSQRDSLGKLMPAQIGTETPYKGAVVEAKVRVWADDEFRAQNVHWQQRFGEQLEYTNEVLAQMFGVRLVADLRSWDHHAPGETLDQQLNELARMDPGTDVVTVIGLTSSRGLVTSTFENIGVAELQGHHLIVRGYADVEERQSFAAAFRDLRADERDLVLEARRRHKTAALLLHELGHNFGAAHEDTAGVLMTPIYSHLATTFSDESRARMQSTIDARVGRDQQPQEGSAKHPTLVVSITAAGGFVIGGSALDEATLGELMQMSFTDDPDTQVKIVPARGAPNAAVSAVLARAKAAGLRHMAISSGE